VFGEDRRGKEFNKHVNKNVFVGKLRFPYKGVETSRHVLKREA